MTVLATTRGLVALRDGKGSPIASAGRTRALLPSAGSVALLRRDGLAATYEAMYRSQVWIAVVVNKLARGVARLPLKTFEMLPDGENRRRVRDHPVPRALAAPWPRGSAFALKQFWMESLGVYGNALTAKVRPDGVEVRELWPIPWRHIETVVAPDGVTVERYVFHGAQDRVALDPADMIHLRATAGPVGISPMEALRRTLALEDAALEWSAGHFRSGASPSGVFKTDKALSKDSIPRLRAELERIYGGVENAGRFAVLDQGLDWRPISHSAVDTALIEQRKLSREEVAAAYDIPPPMVGILDRATFSNIDTQHAMLYQDTLGPWLTMIEEALGAQLVEPEPAGAGVFLEFDLAEVLKADVEKRARAYQMLMQSATLTINERRRLENLPPIEHPLADTVLVPLNMVPLGAAPEEIEARARAAAALGPGLDPLVAPNGHAPRDGGLILGGDA